MSPFVIAIIYCTNYLIYCKQRLVLIELCRWTRRIHHLAATTAPVMLTCKIYSNCPDVRRRMAHHRHDRYDRLYLVMHLNNIAIVESDAGCRFRFVHFVLEMIAFAVKPNAFDFDRMLTHSWCMLSYRVTAVSAIHSIVRDAIDFGSLETVDVGRVLAAIQIAHRFCPIDLLFAFGRPMSAMQSTHGLVADCVARTRFVWRLVRAEYFETYSSRCDDYPMRCPSTHCRHAHHSTHDFAYYSIDY